MLVDEQGNTNCSSRYCQDISDRFCRSVLCHTSYTGFRFANVCHHYGVCTKIEIKNKTVLVGNWIFYKKIKAVGSTRCRIGSRMVKKTNFNYIHLFYLQLYRNYQPRIFPCYQMNLQIYVWLMTNILNLLLLIYYWD